MGREPPWTDVFGTRLVLPRFSLRSVLSRYISFWNPLQQPLFFVHSYTPSWQPHDRSIINLTQWNVSHDAKRYVCRPRVPITDSWTSGERRQVSANRTAIVQMGNLLPPLQSLPVYAAVFTYENWYRSFFISLFIRHVIQSIQIQISGFYTS